MKQTVIEYVGSLNDGGAETLVKDYALLLDKEQFDVKIVVTRDYPEMANSRILRENNVPIIPIYPKWNLLSRIIHKFFSQVYVPLRLKRILRAENAKILHVHLSLLKDLRPISRYLRGIRLLYTCHNVPKLMFCGERKKEFAAAKHLIQHNGLRLIALHDQMRQELNRMFGVENTQVIRNGVHLSRFSHVPQSREQLRSEVGIPENAFVLGHIGRFSEQKNHEFLLKVFCEVCKRQPDAFLLMVGNGELKEQIAEKVQQLGISERVCMLSNRTDIPQLLKTMDVFVFPSRFEGLPVSLVEAQAAGLRCVVSDAISEESFLLDRTVPISLNEPVERWADVVLDDTARGPFNTGLDRFDMSKEIKRLEKLYTGA